MFQSEPILWLQSVAPPASTALLRLVTLLGYAPAYVIVVVALAVRARRRPALAATAALLLAGLATEATKDLVAFPRPDEVDSRVRRTAASRPLAGVERGAAAGFWSMPREEGVAAVRRRAAGDYGFPSGHVSMAAALLLAIAWLFRSRGVLAFAAVWVPLMALSRLALGRHFLGDVLGGLALGALSAAVAVVLFRPLDERRSRRWLELAMPAALALALAALTPFVPWLDPRYAGACLGLVACWYAPAESFAASARGRLALATVAAVVLAAAALLTAWRSWSTPRSSPIALLVTSAGIVVVTFHGAPALARGLGSSAPA